NSVTSIDGGAFEGCSGLTSVTIGNSVTSIGNDVFECGLLQYWNPIKELNWNAINCTSMGMRYKGNIEKVTIGDGVEVLPGGFVSGSKITSVTIPNSVTSIGSNAFAGCSGLMQVCSKIVEPEGVQMGDNVFAGIPFTTCKLNVPSGTIASYQSADQWKDFLLIFDIGIYDVNLDGTIDIADVNAVVNKMLERDGAPTKERADVNCDDDVDIIDVNEVISAMLGYGNLPEPPSRTQTYTVNGVSFNMIVVDGGTFTMGATPEQGSDADSDEKPAHQVTLSSYSIGQTEVTQELWQAVMGSNPSYFTGDLQRPVEWVSWDDCQTFITKLNQLTGKNFRLPTEAEWEYAARGGNQSQNYKFAGSNNVDEVAWYRDNSGSTTHPVATKAPNELGLYDMSGNVWEWCQDWIGNYSSDAQINPTGPTSGSYRVLRGGCLCNYARLCRVSYRYYETPSYPATLYLGLRLAL
ncbi:MAG: SUMF1/EgtB/PvdO family nonheme iron enzyme, partial [Muribaculaceae bacterium]|nr:SUMF1/EgtB/PvdO family nonheme iron enzyme [Muribaculaceae bacterium]